ncbi:MAG: hypothetical protein C0P74_011225 [Gammaproteobacteria bacterium]|nr:hypothetical protein [Gammaproteobacteria bacterium]
MRDDRQARELGGNDVKLCAIDKAVLEAHAQGRDWRTVPGIRSAARFRRVLARAQWRQKNAKST